MASAADNEYKAFVLWWNAGTIAVLCPLCNSPEEQDWQPYSRAFDSGEPVLMTALCCSSRVPYQAMFPWMVKLGWEKNLDKRRFETVGLAVSGHDRHDSLYPMSRLGFQAGKYSQAWGIKPARGLAANPLSLRQGGEMSRFQKESLSLFRMCIDLGDLRLLRSTRPKRNCIKVLAPAATIDNKPLSDPLAVISSLHTLKGKTLAILDRKGTYPYIIAVSGWKDSLSSPDNVIDQDLWSEQARVLAEYVTHEPKDDNMDKGIRGRVYFSHAEKQLIAYVVRLHDLPEDGFEDYEMDTLKASPSHHKLKEVWIAIDHEACPDCKDYKQKVEAVCKIKIHFVRMKDNFRFKKDIRIPKTPTRTSTKKSHLLTPPDSDSSPTNNFSDAYSEEEDDESDEYQGAASESPSYQRTLRSFATTSALTARPENSHLSRTAPTPHYRKPKKMIRSENPDSSEEGFGAPTKRRNRHSMTSDPEPRRRPVQTRLRNANFLPTNPQPTLNAQQQRQEYTMPSASLVSRAIDEVADSDHERPARRNAFIARRPRPAGPRSRAGKNFPPPGVEVIDISSDDDDDDN